MNKTLSVLFVILFVWVGNVGATPITWATNGHTYEVVDVERFISWETAKTEAEARGGYLATLTSAAESAFVWDLVDEFVDFIDSYNVQEFTKYWLGGYQTDSTNEPKGNWSWVTGETWGYENWYPNEPNNGVGGTQHYLHFWPKDGKWDDMENGRYMSGYIVERSPVPEPATLLLMLTGLAGMAAIGRRKKGEIDILA